MSVKKILHRGLRSIGLHVERFRDPYEDVVSLLCDQQVTNIVDGGAYHGSTTNRLLSLFPEATVHAFEPQQESYDHLQSKFADNGRVRIYMSALSDHGGHATLHVNKQAFTTSLLTSTLPTMTAVGTQDVSLTTLDNWARESLEAVPELLKLDLQGHELAALQGAEGILRNGAMALITEVNFQPRYKDCCLFHDITAYLYGLDFHLHGIYEIVTGSRGAWVLADALYIHSKISGQL